MITRNRAIGPALSMTLFILVDAAFCQTPVLKDLTDKPVTVEQLIDALSTKRGVTRGIYRSAVAGSCNGFREKAERGIVLEPVSDTAALRVEFASGSARFTPASKKILATLGQALASEPLKDCCFEVQGYTDSVGGAAYNMRLSQKRAKAVVDYLVRHSTIDPNRMIPLGFGMSRPLVSNDTAEGRTKNRRVQVFNIGSVSGPDN